MKKMRKESIKHKIKDIKDIYCQILRSKDGEQSRTDQERA